jgi:hypothetical protein
MVRSDAKRQPRSFMRRRPRRDQQRREEIDRRARPLARADASASIVVHGSKCICHVCNRYGETGRLAA